MYINIGELLGAMAQTGMSPSFKNRMNKSLGGGRELDTQQEKNYLAELAAGLDIEFHVTERIQQLVGLQTA
jgi:hypothetical protein